MQEREEFNERKNSNDPRNAGYKGRELIPPDIGFDGTMTLYFGGLTFQITAEGRGHSTGDLTVYIPQKRVYLMGDLLDTEIHPGQGESAGVFYSNVKGWLQILDNIMARNLPVETYVPGSWSGAHRPRRERSGGAETLLRGHARRSREDDRRRQESRSNRKGI